jgi:hypothetical protein
VQFFLFDVSTTLVFLVGYLAVAALPRETQKARPAEPCGREWPRLSAPR